MFVFIVSESPEENKWFIGLKDHRRIVHSEVKPELNTLVITDNSNCSDRSFPLILGHATYVRTWPFRDTTWSAILHRTEINSENPEENNLNGSLDRKITEELFIQKLKPELNNKYRQLSVENFLV